MTPREPFLLATEHRPDGTSVLTYDAGPDKRVNVVTLTETAHIVTNINGGELLNGTLSPEERTMVNRRHQQ